VPQVTDRISSVFERAPVLVARLRPLVPQGTSPEAIVAAARGIIESLDEAGRIAILDAHPRIGADPASLSDLSRSEQGATGDVATLAELVRLNDEYERRFGFRFVVFVNGRTKEQLLPVLRRRSTRSRAAELAAGIDEFLAIALARLRMS
jgi:2-oxo-4-hydroxy-4-carboxy--5-ureidoimidazoline (OHCU) decarboxylase